MIDKTAINEARAIIGSMLRKLRESKGLNQTQLGEAIGITKNTISKVENGKFDFGVDILIKSAQVFGVEVIIKEKEVNL